MLEVRPALALVTLVVLVITGVLVVRAATVSSRQPVVEPAPAGPVDAQAAAERLAGALRYPTLSPPHPELGYAPYDSLRAYLEASFPRVHVTLDREIVGGQSLLYTWPGRDAALEPVLLLAHLDVVPVEPGTEEEWTHPPFGGRVADGYVWDSFAQDPSPVSPTDAPAFERLAGVIRQTFPDVTVAPYLVIGATDARHYVGLSAHVYRFHPARLLPDELDGFHGIDERIGVEAYADAVRFYRRLVLETAGPAGSR